MDPKCKNQAAFHIVEPKSGRGLHKKDALTDYNPERFLLLKI